MSRSAHEEAYSVLGRGFVKTDKVDTMFARILLVGALLVASLAYLFGGSLVNDASSVSERDPYIQGKNKTVLFFANKEHGLSNVLVATASALLENYPDIDVHYASFPGMADKLKRVSSFARKRTPSARAITYHEIKGLPYGDACYSGGNDIESVMQVRGAAGIGRFAEKFQHFISPWTVEDHMAMYEELGAMIDEIDPAVVVLDTLFRPALDATRDKNRLHAFITPNTLVDNFIADQGFFKMLYKYPALASGFKYPVPLWNIPENIYINFRVIYAAVKAPLLVEKVAALRERGLKDPINFLGMHRPDVPWITMNTEGASIPVEVVPENVTCAGPIVISSAPAAEQDPELAAWLKKAPTVLISLGSHYDMTENQIVAMVLAIKEMLDKTNVQVLWKYIKRGNYSDDFLLPIQKYLDNGRLRASHWLTVDLYSILETGDITAFVHHGGSNCYHEGVLSGVPQVLLPMWIDLYNFAALVETNDIGIWACKDDSPAWTAECLSSAFLEVIDGGAHSLEMRKSARALGDKVSAGEKGRDISARRISELAYVR